ncbi:MAG: flagellin [Synergistaceae bacterium]|nr:flagellin [Synergistaceae bacterium]
MSMIMNHDITSLMGQRIMMRNSLAMKRSLEKLSTGLRTKIADLDNTAGLAISETMRSRIFGMEKALYNTQDGISLIQTASGALEQTNSMLMRMRELSVQAANDVLTQQDRSYIQVEINEIRDEITRLANTTQFNRKKILSGDNAVLWSSTSKEVKAIVNGGIRSIDQFGQKYAVDGNYKLKIRAEAGQAEVQKSDILKIRQAGNDSSNKSVIVSKSVNTAEGLKDVKVDSMPDGSYSVNLGGGSSPDPLLHGSYGIGGISTESTVTTSFNTTNSPVNKITVSTDDGIEIWSTSGANIFRTDTADSTAQTEYFNSVLNEIKHNAAYKGIKVNGNDITSLTISKPGTEAVGLKISYEGGGAGNAPTSTIDSTVTDFASVEDMVTVDSGDALSVNASILFEVKKVDSITGTVTLSAKANILSKNGANSTANIDDIMLTDGQVFNLGDAFDNAVTVSLSDFDHVYEGGKFAVAVTAKNVDRPLGFNIFSQNFGYAGVSTYALEYDSVPENEINFSNYFIDSKSGEVTNGTITLVTGPELRNAADKLLTVDYIPMTSFTVTNQARTAEGNTKIRDIDKFWNSEGVYLVQQPQELTLTQGDGTQAKVTIYGNDTLDDVVKKLNTAVAVGLGQAKYVDDASKFVTFTEGGTLGTNAVAGTIVFRSALTGSKGQISISGNEELLNALSLNTIQEARESTYNVDVVDAHDNSVIAQNVNITGNRLIGVVHKNVDVEFDSMMGLQATWNESIGGYSIQSTTGNNGSDVVLHLADNTMIFQTGAGEGEDVMLAIGDMSSNALGLDRINVMSREKASYSIDIIDKAIDRVSMQQAKLGAAQNRLEHHLGNLSKETESLIEANSRIRDTDYASEILEFTKMQILMQANTAMLAQSNQLQTQTILSVLRQ